MYIKYKEFVLHRTVALGNLEGDFHFFLTLVARQGEWLMSCLICFTSVCIRLEVWWTPEPVGMQC